MNYVNLATARASLRAREVAMRKVLGADRAALIRQFLGEAIATAALAALLGLILAELGLPFVNAAAGLALTIPYVVVVPSLALVVLIVGLLAGFYPALLLSRYPAAAVLASARAPGGGRAGTHLREALVVFQFGLAIAFVTGTMILAAQTAHVRTADLGFRREGLLTVPSLLDKAIWPARATAILAALRTVPGVVSVGVGGTGPGGDGSANVDVIEMPGRPLPGLSVGTITTGKDFFRTYGVTLLAGRLFDDAHSADDLERLEGMAEGAQYRHQPQGRGGARLPLADRSDRQDGRRRHAAHDHRRDRPAPLLRPTRAEPGDILRLLSRYAADSGGGDPLCGRPQGRHRRGARDMAEARARGSAVGRDCRTAARAILRG
ncbi:FtsX-like permease family protein [Sphingomonas aerolata]|uniref:FtsX-like permease family protein n=1 Tax=Sphingomonas aerolata TaxID=185951 RepID=UPI002FE418B3